MLNDRQMGEIREHLERAQNPVFYYDNDADGLCSYVLFARFLGRGKGVAVRSFPDLNKSYARKASELGADYVFVLDKPIISKEFVEEIDKLGLPLVWIDHHDVKNGEFDEKEFKNFYVYNSGRGKKEAEPVTYIAYTTTQIKNDIWIAMMGCIADHFLPDFADEFYSRWPDFWASDVKQPFDAYFGTEIGRLAKALNFGLKDSVSNVVRLQKFLVLCSSPMDVLSEVPANYSFRNKVSEVRVKYRELLERARGCISGKMLFFEYAGELSISADLANELSYLFPKKFIVVSYKKGEIANLSLRGKDVKGILEKVFAKVGGSGGGHEDAVGARIKTSDLPKFREVFEEEIKG